MSAGFARKTRASSRPRAALEKANAALADLDAEPVTLEHAAADDDAVKRARRDLDRAAGSGGADDDAAGGGEAAAQLLEAAKAEHAEFEAKLTETRLRDALERYKVNDDGKVVPLDSSTETFEHFVASHDGTRSMPSRGGAQDSGGRSSRSPNPTLEAFRSGRSTLTELGRAAREKPEIMPYVQRPLKGK